MFSLRNHTLNTQISKFEHTRLIKDFSAFLMKLSYLYHVFELRPLVEINSCWILRAWYIFYFVIKLTQVYIKLVNVRRLYLPLLAYR